MLLRSSRKYIEKKSLIFLSLFRDIYLSLPLSTFFFLNDPAPTEIYTFSLHDPLPISAKKSPREISPPRSTQFFFFYSAAPPRHLLSFPKRRSSCPRQKSAAGNFPAPFNATRRRPG